MSAPPSRRLSGAQPSAATPRGPGPTDAVALLRVFRWGPSGPPPFPLDVRLSFDRPIVVGREGQLRGAPTDPLASALHARFYGELATGRLLVEDLDSRAGVHRRLVGLFRLEDRAELRFRDLGFRVTAGGLEPAPLDRGRDGAPSPTAADVQALAAALGPTLRHGAALIGECPEGAEPVYQRLVGPTELHAGDEVLVGGLGLRIFPPRRR